MTRECDDVRNAKPIIPPCLLEMPRRPVKSNIGMLIMEWRYIYRNGVVAIVTSGQAGNIMVERNTIEDQEFIRELKARVRLCKFPVKIEFLGNNKTKTADRYRSG